nr:50S ribosomal protein L20 [uncultured Halomonas sp.]
MPRVRKGSARKRAHKRVLREARGYYGTKSRHFQQAKVALTRAGAFAWRDRRARKRDMRRLWITRINAAARLEGFTYSQFMHGLSKAGIEMDRKVLSAMAADEAGFKAVADKVRAALA